MFGRLGQILFPDEVEVLEIIPQRQYVYPIFKNGSTSLHKSSYLAVNNQELKNLTNIEVFVRNPHDRFLSGVQTYISQLGAECDSQTVLALISQNLYLNRHFCPQLYWILNLSRFTSAKLTIKPFEELSLITGHIANQSIPNPKIAEFFKKNSKILFFNEIDEVLTVNLIGKTVTIEEILYTLKENYTELYNDTFKTAKEILNVLP